MVGIFKNGANNRKEMIYTKEDIREFATETFGDKDKADIWLTTPIRVLNDKTPNSRLENVEGIEEVRAILSKIEFGEFT